MTSFQPKTLLNLNIGRYMAMSMTPTKKPTITIINGSIIVDTCLDCCCGTKPTRAIVKSERTIEETGKIDLGEKFTLFNLDSGLKVGKGQVLEIVKQG